MSEAMRVFMFVYKCVCGCVECVCKCVQYLGVYPLVCACTSACESVSWEGVSGGICTSVCPILYLEMY